MIDDSELAGREIYAHSANELGERHLLVNHLRNVSILARERAEMFGGGEVAFLAGLWHDAGKADPAWQRYLLESESGTRVRGTGPDHKVAGALLAEESDQPHIGLLIKAHHGGLNTPADHQQWLDERRQLQGPQSASSALRQVMPDLEGNRQAMFPAHIQSDGLAAEFFLRMVYSALVDADSLDTEAHYLSGNPSNRGSPVPLAELWERFEVFLAKQPPVSDGPVNLIRDEVYQACIKSAEMDRGFFRLTVPTGGGKTRSAMAFALRHGIKHGLRRVIIAVPFLTITQQTAQAYRDIFGDDHVVLEHHSGSAEASDDDSFARDAVWQRLAAENWDAPVVVTTTVQLFESLFSNRRSRTRKLHNLAQSVIVLDEAQALPPSLLAPILDGLRQLTQHCGASVVVSTATQPAFESIKEFRDVQAFELVPQHRRHFKAVQRVRYEWRTERPNQWCDVAGWMREERSVLAIVNTKNHALELLDELNDPEALHLSTLLCGAHRAEVLNEIKERLEAGSPCHVVSTQVVEAGVDLDFPAVFRAEAPLDAIIQAAGRCNREGTLGERGGRVVVFRTVDDKSPPGVYRSGRDLARVVRELPDFDLNDPQTVGRYFDHLFGVAVDSDKAGIQRYRKQLNYPKVAEKFRMIEDDRCDVIVDYPDQDAGKIDALVKQLRARERPPREVLRELQPHMVSLNRREYETRRKSRFLEEVLPGVGRWPQGYYDEVRGLTDTDPAMVI